MNVALRPRSLGEILDRGLTVFVQTFPLALRLLIPTIVASVMLAAAYFSAHRSVRNVVALVVVLVVPIVVFVALTSIVYLYGCAASGRTCTVREAFAGGLARIVPLFGYALTLMFTAGVAVGILFLALFFAIAGIPKVTSGGAFGLIAGWTLIVVGIPLFVAVYVWFTTLVTVGMVACVCEERGPFTSLRLAFVRCTRAGQWVRAALIGLAIAGSGFVVGLVVASLSGVIAEAMPANPLAIAIASAVQVAFQAVVAMLGYAWTVVFAVDARIRLEGLDLVAAAEVE